MPPYIEKKGVKESNKEYDEYNDSSSSDDFNKERDQISYRDKVGG